MLRLATQGEADRLGDQVAAALHSKGRRVVRLYGHSGMHVTYLCSRGRTWCLLRKGPHLAPMALAPLYLATQRLVWHACSTRGSRS